MTPDDEVTWAMVGERKVKLTHLSKTLYPDTDTTKGEVLSYYAAVAPALLPRLAGRPVTRIRWPHGVSGPHFFEKNAPGGHPSWLTTARVGSVTYPLVEDLATLTYLANLSSLEFHVPQWRLDDAGSPAPPDRLVIDLDPGKPAGLSECAQVALLVRTRLEPLGFPLIPVTSGSKGMQLYAPLPATLPANAVRDAIAQLAGELATERPDLVVANMTKALRPGKVLLDWSQNDQNKTTIAPYSLRGRDLPTAATPITWDEVESWSTDPEPAKQFLYNETLERLERLGDLMTAHS